MKTISRLQRSSILQMVFICLAFTGFLAHTPAYSDTATDVEISTTSNTRDGNAISPNTEQNPPLTQNKSIRKKSLIDKSRDLSAFFILGIAINIIMAVTFAWWFSREWRRSKKNVQVDDNE
jgi:hypothetical protein